MFSTFDYPVDSNLYKIVPHYLASTIWDNECLDCFRVDYLVSKVDYLVSKAMTGLLPTHGRRGRVLSAVKAFCWPQRFNAEQASILILRTPLFALSTWAAGCWYWLLVATQHISLQNGSLLWTLSHKNFVWQIIWVLASMCLYLALLPESHNLLWGIPLVVNDHVWLELLVLCKEVREQTSITFLASSSNQQQAQVHVKVT